MLSQVAGFAIIISVVLFVFFCGVRMMREMRATNEQMRRVILPWPRTWISVRDLLDDETEVEQRRRKMRHIRTSLERK